MVDKTQEELLQEIAKIIKREFMLITPLDMAKLIFSKVLKAGYLSPEEVEAKMEEANRHASDVVLAAAEQAKKQKRERIFNEIEETFKDYKVSTIKDVLASPVWQALKSANKG